MASVTLRLTRPPEPAPQARPLSRREQIHAIKRAKLKQPWVAVVIGVGGRFGLEREFMPAQKDAVADIYELQPGPIYEVNENLGYTTRRYFCRIVDGRSVKMSKAEVVKHFSEGAR
jgi:hypothetical protein